jgi:multidrug efflux system membrane fusion protein
MAQRNRSNRRLVAVGVAVAALAGVAWWMGWIGGGGASPNARGGFANNLQAVGVTQARSGPMDVEVTGLGTVTPRRTVTVHTQTDGQLMKLYFTEGQLVKEGEPLADLDDRPAKAQLAQAQGQLARDQALLATARLDLERYQTLFAQDSIARQQLDTQASLVKQYEGAVRTDEGQVANAQVQVTYAHIKAPISGRAGLRQVDPGNVVHSGDENGLVVITELDPIDALFTIPEDRLGDVNGAMSRATADDPSGTIFVSAWDRTNQTQLASGTLVAVDNQVDVSTGTVKLKAEFPNPDGKLFPNQFVNARMLLEHRENQVIVPAAAVQQGSKGAFVYVLVNSPTTVAARARAQASSGSGRHGRGGRGAGAGGNSPWVVSLRGVTVGPAQDDSVSILSGLDAGETIVTDGADRLKDGARVMVPQLASSTAPMPAASPAPAAGAVSATAPGTVSATLQKEHADSPAHPHRHPGRNNGGNGNGNADE